MNDLLKEIEHELVCLDGLYVTDKDLGYFTKEDKESENYWRIDTSPILKKIHNKLNGENLSHQKEIVTRIENTLKEMKRMNEIIKRNPKVSEADRLYFDNQFGILKMEFDYLMILLEL